MEPESLRPSSKMREGLGRRPEHVIRVSYICSIVPRPTFLPLTSHLHKKIPGSPHSSCNQKWCGPRNKASLPGLEIEREPGTYSHHQSEVTIGDLKMNVGYREMFVQGLKSVITE